MVKSKEPPWSKLRPLFLYLPDDVIKKTWERTTRYARIPMSTTLRRVFKSPFPAFNVPRHSEPVSTDTIYSDTPAIDGGQKYAQIFHGKDTKLTDVYGITSQKEFVNTLEDNIRECGAMSKLISDCAQVEISKKVKSILHAFCICD